MKPRKVNSILELVGGTPLVRINRLNPNTQVALYAKLEFMNPGGSVKDRPALRMIEAAELSGALTKDKIVLEATSGNTGIGLAMVCSIKGYRMLFTMSESVSEERRRILRAYGAEILNTPGHLSTDGAIEEAYRLAREEPDRYFLADQFNNDDNWRAHYEAGTADEIWEASEGQVSAVICTMGTTGTLMGITRRMGELSPGGVKVIGVEPFQGHKIQGLKNMKESYAPGIYNQHEPHAIVNVDDDSAYETARRLAREEGLFVGMSAGAAMRAALDYAADLDQGMVVAILPDTGERYLSTKLFVSEKVPVPLKFHNTLTRRYDDLVPLRPGQVSIYSCGPSLDGYSDLSLCRRMVFADLARRYLEFRNFDVKLVINLADCDDRTVNQCLSEEADIKKFTAKWSKAFFEDMEVLQVGPPHQYPKASEHVPQMLDMARELIAKDLAYVKLSSVYFNISKFPDYGKLSHMDLGAVQTGKTTNQDYYEKENPHDFTLFKRSSLAELKAGIYWPSPWGNVRPGWHVECALMSIAHLGQPFDLHLASSDLIFPHGDNEIAICEGLSGKPLANQWLHCEVVTYLGRKISRTLNNDLTLRDLLATGYPPAAIRYWLLSQHYRRALDCNRTAMEAAAKAVARLNDFVSRLAHSQAGEAIPNFDQLLYDVFSNTAQAMDQDLNVPKAMGHLFAFIRKVNALLSAGRVDEAQIHRVLDFMRRVNQVLMVMDFSGVEIEPEVKALVKKREQARRQCDYAAADALRDQICALGYQLVDGPAGTRCRKV